MSLADKLMVAGVVLIGLGIAILLFTTLNKSL